MTSCLCLMCFSHDQKIQKVAGVSGNGTPAISGKSAVGEMFLHLARMDRSKVVSTHLWNTPLNLYQQAIQGFLS